MNKLIEKITFKPTKIDFLVVLFILILTISLKILGVTEIPENSLVENFQLIVLGLGAVYCFIQKKYNPDYKVINTFFAMILILMFLREISYGRCIFCQIDGNPNEFYKWSHYKYGYLVHFAVALYIAYIAIYAIINKIRISAVNALQSVKFPFVSFLLTLFAVAVQLYSEKVGVSTFNEEISELAMYLLITGVIYYYNSILLKK